MEPAPFVRGEHVSGSTAARNLHIVANVVDVGLIGKALGLENNTTSLQAFISRTVAFLRPGYTSQATSEMAM